MSKITIFFCCIISCFTLNCKQNELIPIKTLPKDKTIKIEIVTKTDTIKQVIIDTVKQIIIDTIIKKDTVYKTDIITKQDTVYKTDIITKQDTVYKTDIITQRDTKPYPTIPKKPTSSITKQKKVYSIESILSSTFKSKTENEGWMFTIKRDDKIIHSSTKTQNYFFVDQNETTKSFTTLNGNYKTKNNKELAICKYQIDGSSIKVLCKSPNDINDVEIPLNLVTYRMKLVNNNHITGIIKWYEYRFNSKELGGSCHNYPIDFYRTSL